MLPLDIDRDSHIACRVRRPKIVLGASGLGRAGMAKRDGDGRPRGDTGNDRCGTDVIVRLEIRSSTRKKDGTDGCFSSIPRPMQPHATCRLRPTLYLGPN